MTQELLGLLAEEEFWGDHVLSTLKRRRLQDDGDELVFPTEEDSSRDLVSIFGEG